ncbi:MAG: DUF4153 domain-containing protein [Agathobacter sp.]
MYENMYQDNQLVIQGQMPGSGMNPDQRRSTTALFPFEKAALACLLYTLLYTFCIYKNISGITMPVWVAGMIALSCYFIKLAGKQLKKDSYFVIVMMLLIGISTFFTGNEYIIWMNYPAEFLLLVSLLLHNFAEDSKWDMGKYFAEILNAVFGAIGCIGKPFSEGNAYIKKHKKEANGKWQYVMIGIAIAIPCVLFLGFLLGTADKVFEHILVSIFSSFTIPTRVFGIGFMLLFGFFSSYCGIFYIAEHSDKITVTPHKNGEPVLAITITGMIGVLYAFFSVIQIVYLFIGKMELPEGMTYAQYARTGFFQLLFVCILNVILVLSMKKYFKESKVLNGILLMISGCTYIMTLSSAIRMCMYISTYQLTFLRVFVLVALFTIAVLLVGVILTILKPEFSFFRFGIVVISSVYVIFAFSHVDYFIAKYNLSKVQENVEENSFSRYNADYQYISNLSTDAAPVIVEYAVENGQEKDVWFTWYCKQNEHAVEEITIRNFNVSHAIAKGMLK